MKKKKKNSDSAYIDTFTRHQKLFTQNILNLILDMIQLTKSGSLSREKVISEEITPAMQWNELYCDFSAWNLPYYFALIVFLHPPWALSLLLANI